MEDDQRGNDSDQSNMDLDIHENSPNNQSDLNNLIVNYLPEAMTQEDLQKMFISFGEIESCKLIKDRTTGHSLGYGFVKFLHHQNAKNALNNLDGLMLQHKKIKVSFARPSNEPIKTANVYVSGLKNNISEAELIAIFSVYGKVLTVKVKNNDGDARKANAIGFVRFERHQCAEEAIQRLDQTKPLNNPTPIHVSFAKQSNATQVANAFTPAVPVMKQFGFTNPIMQTRSVLAYQKFTNNFGKTQAFSAKNARFDPLGKNNLRTYMTDNMFPTAENVIPPVPDAKGYPIFVFNIAPDCEEVKLWRLFGPFGAVNDVNIVMDKETNKSKGFAFVTMSNYREAEIAIQSINHSSLDGKVLQVSFKKERQRN